MRAKKNEPLSNLGKKVMRVVEKGTLVTLVTFVLEVTRTASLHTTVEEITPRPKKQRVANKGKKKVDSCSLSI